MGSSAPAANTDEAVLEEAVGGADSAGYMSFPSHRVLVLKEVHWDAFEKQFKLVEFRPGSRRNITPGMFLLFLPMYCTSTDGKDVPVASRGY
jgi:hypothetical protein